MIATNNPTISIISLNEIFEKKNFIINNGSKTIYDLLVRNAYVSLYM